MCTILSLMAIHPRKSLQTPGLDVAGVHDYCTYYCGFGTVGVEAPISDASQRHNYPTITRPVTQMPTIVGRVIVRVIVVFFKLKKFSI